MPTGHPSLTKNQKQEIEATTVLLVVLTQRRFYWSCLRNEGFIGRAYATTGRDLLVVLTQRGFYWSCLRNDGFIGRAYATTGRDLLVVLTQRRDLLVVLTQRRDGIFKN